MNADLRIDLDGDTTGAVVEWEDFQVMATFESENAQPNITVNTELTFVNEYAEKIQDWIDAGFITEGMSIDFSVNGSYNVFSGIVDLMDDLKVIDPTTYKSKVKPSQGLNRLSDRAEGLTFAYLEEINYINTTDFISVPYVVEKEFNFVEFALVSLSIYLLTEQFINQIRKVQQDIIDLAAIIAGGISGAVAALVWQAAKLLIDIAFATAVLISLVDMIREMLSMLISPVKFHKAIRVKTLLEKASAFLGYSYSTSISEINGDELVFLPSKREIIQDNQINQLIANLTINQPGLGIPNAKDYGYTFAELIDAMNRTFGAKIAIKNGVIEHHALNSAWWLQTSSYQMPDVLTESFSYNTDELIGTRLVEFETDVSDYWTIENFAGTVTEIRTSQPSPMNPANVLIKGLERHSIPYALGSRKDGLNRFEDFILDLAIAADKLINFFGGNGTNEQKIVARVGMLKLSKDWFNIPKLMKMNTSNKLDSNHRANWGSDFLWNNYINYFSFVTGQTNQWKIFNDYEICVGFEDFLLLIDNSYFYTNDGSEAKIEKLIWEPNKDTAKVTFRVRNKYQSNLNEQIL